MSSAIWFLPRLVVVAPSSFLVFLSLSSSLPLVSCVNKQIEPWLYLLLVLSDTGFILGMVKGESWFYLAAVLS